MVNKSAILGILHYVLSNIKVLSLLSVHTKSIFIDNTSQFCVILALEGEKRYVHPTGRLGSLLLSLFIVNVHN
jgi:hypothetical protein